MGEVVDFQVINSPIPELTERERRFAVAFFEYTLETGRDIGAELPSYRRAFPEITLDDSSAYHLACALTNAPRVRELVGVLRRDYSQRAVVPPDHIIEQLERVAYANILDYMRVDEATGRAYVNLNGVTHEQMSAVKEITDVEHVSPNGQVHRKTTLKLHDKMTALDRLSRIHGLYSDSVGELTVDQVDRVISAMRRRLRLTQQPE